MNMTFWQKNKKIISTLVMAVIVANFASVTLFTPNPVEAEWGGLGSIAGAAGGAAAGGLLCLIPPIGLGCAAAVITGLAGGVVAGLGYDIWHTDTVQNIAGGLNAISKGATLGTKIADGTIFGDVLVYISVLVFNVSSAIFTTLSIVFTTLIAYGLNTNLLPLDAIKSGWSIALGVTNIFFIFVILYISLSTILGLGSSNTWKLLGKLIMIALLINFSLTFTNVIIDSSNILAREFWTAATPLRLSDGSPDIASTIKNAFAFDNLTKTANQIQTADNVRTDAIAAGKTPEEATALAGTWNGMSLSTTNIGLMYLGISAFILVACLVLGTGAAIFMVRLIKLMALMILSPLAFFGWIVPATEGWTKEWWKNLTGEAFLAPAFMFFYYIAFLMVLGSSSATINQSTFIPRSGAQYGELVTYLVTDKSATTGEEATKTIIRFVLITALLLGATTVAASMSNSTAKVGGQVASFAFGTGFGAIAAGGRQSLGRVGEALYQSQEGKSGAIAGALRSVGDYGRKSSYDVRNAPVLGSTLEQAAGASGMESRDFRGGASLGSIYTSDSSKNVGGFAKGAAEARTKKEQEERTRVEEAKKREFDTKKNDLLNNLNKPDETTGAIDHGKIRSTLQSLDDTQFLGLSDDILKPGNEHLMKNLSEHHVQLLTSRGNISQTDKTRIKTAIMDPANSNADGKKFYKEETKKQAAVDFGTEVMRNNTDPNHVTAELNKIDPKTLIHVDPAILTDPYVAKQLSSAHLQTLFDEYMSGSGKVTEQTLKDLRRRATGLSAQRYFGGPTGLLWPM